MSISNKANVAAVEESFRQLVRIVILDDVWREIVSQNTYPDSIAQVLGELVVANIAPDNYNSYEDWWVHPKLVDRTIIDLMKNTSDKPKRADKYMMSYDETN